MFQNQIVYFNKAKNILFEPQNEVLKENFKSDACTIEKEMKKIKCLKIYKF